MLSNLFLGFSLLGADWVLYILIALSIVSIGLIVDRLLFYKSATRDLLGFRKSLRDAVGSGEWDRALQIAKTRTAAQRAENRPDLEAAMAEALIQSRSVRNPEVLTQIASSPVIESRVAWEKKLTILATIGNNAPFIGLFGTVLGIIKAFHDLSQQAQTGVSGVTAGVSEALVATAVGIFVAIPAVVGYNTFQRRSKTALQEAEALKSYLIGKIAGI